MLLGLLLVVSLHVYEPVIPHDLLIKIIWVNPLRKQQKRQKLLFAQCMFFILTFEDEISDRSSLFIWLVWPVCTSILPLCYFKCEFKVPSGRGKGEGVRVDRRLALPLLPLPLSSSVKNLSKRTARWHLYGADGESHLPHTPQPGITKLRVFPVGLLARKWGSLSLGPDCVITYPVFLTPQTLRVQMRPHSPGLPKGVALVGSSSASLSSRDWRADGGWPWAALSWKPRRCPGLPRQTSTPAKAEQWRERRAPAWGQAQVRGKNWEHCLPLPPASIDRSRKAKSEWNETKDWILRFCLLVIL